MLSGSPLSKYWSIIPRHLCFISGSLPFDRHTKLSFFFSCVYYYVYCWFSVSRHSKYIKIKIKTVQWIKSGIWEMKGGKHTKTIAKIQVRRIFRIRDTRRNVFPKFIEICMETP